MIYTESEKDSLRRFMRVESPLVANSRSIRNEVTSGDVKTDSAEKDTEIKDEPIDYLKGMDVDNLPSEVVERLKAANEQIGKVYTEAKGAKEKLTKTEKLARDFQGQKDRAFAMLQKHNLIDENGNSAVKEQNNKTSAEDLAIMQGLKDEFIAMGLQPNVAEMQAQLAFRSQKAFQGRLEKDLLAKVGQGLNPALKTVGDLHATNLLKLAEQNDDTGPLLEIPEVYKNTVEVVSSMVEQGQTITPEVISNLVDMAWGKYLRTTPEEKRFKKEEPMRQTAFSTRGNKTGGGYAAPQSQNYSAKGSVPTAANSETAAAIAATFGVMKSDLQSKGRGK